MPIDENEKKMIKVETLLKAGKSLVEISKETSIPYSTIRKMVRRLRENNTTARKKGSGRIKKLEKEQISIIRGIVKDKPKTSASKIASEVHAMSGKLVSSSTIRKELHEENFISAYAPLKPFLSDLHIRKRFDFAKAWLLKPFRYFKHVIFSDESRFNIFQSDGRVKVWREPGARYESKNLSPTVKFGGGSIMVWGCIGYNGVGKLQLIDGNLDKIGYVRVLSTNLHESAEILGLGDDFIFQQDGAPCHTAAFTKEFFTTNNIEVIDWPAQSPDLNPIEHVWSFIGNQLKKCNIRNKNDLISEVTRIWYEIPTAYIRKLFESIPRRVEAVIRNKGGHIPY